MGGESGALCEGVLLVRGVYLLGQHGEGGVKRQHQTSCDVWSEDVTT